MIVHIVHIVPRHAHAHAHAQAIMHAYAHRIARVRNDGNTIGGVKPKNEVGHAHTFYQIHLRSTSLLQFRVVRSLHKVLREKMAP